MRTKTESHPYTKLIFTKLEMLPWDLEKNKAYLHKITYQQGVPTKVFLERCLSPVSNMHADTPKSANLTAPLESIKILPACKGRLRTLIRKKSQLHHQLER